MENGNFEINFLDSSAPITLPANSDLQLIGGAISSVQADRLRHIQACQQLCLRLETCITALDEHHRLCGQSLFPLLVGRRSINVSAASSGSSLTLPATADENSPSANWTASSNSAQKRPTSSLSSTTALTATASAPVYVPGVGWGSRMEEGVHVFFNDGAHLLIEHGELNVVAFSAPGSASLRRYELKRECPDFLRKRIELVPRVVEHLSGKVRENLQLAKNAASSPAMLPTTTRTPLRPLQTKQAKSLR